MPNIPSTRSVVVLASLTLALSPALAHSDGRVLFGVVNLDSRNAFLNYARIDVEGQTVLARTTEGALRSWGSQLSLPASLSEGLDRTRDFACGGAHSLALKSDGTIFCWGDNSLGQCDAPQNVLDGVDVAAGSGHSLLRRADGRVLAWGWNWAGQCDVPDTAAASTGIAAGAFHSLAVNTAGEVIAWGDDVFGQCSVPSRLAGVTAVDAGSAFSAALRADGTVQCWGDNKHGQCTVPAGMTDVLKLRCGDEHCVVLRSGGTVSAWGRNDSGECAVPPGLHGVLDVGAGYRSTCAVTPAGKVLCWGGAEASVLELGTMEAFHTASAVVESNGAGLMLTASGGVFPWGSAAAEIPPPMPVKPTALAVGYAHRAALLENGTVVCWGDNSWGQCDVPFVLSVPGIARAREIALGEVHCFAVTTAGDLHYWGYDENPIPPGFTATAVASGAVHLLALRSDGTVSGWRGTPVPADLGNVTKIAAGYWHSVALRANGVVQCWGRDSQGECNVPPDLGPVRDIAGYREGTAALTADGRVVVWGGYIASQAYPGPPATRISGGPLASSIVATLDTDCNADGVPDSTQLDQQDCDGNGILDACDIQMGMMEDCNGNAISDACEKQLQIDLSSGPIGPIGYQQSVAWTIPRATLAAAPFTLRIRGRGDFGGQLEAISISLGNLNLGTALAGTADCVVTAWQQFTGTDFALNSALDTEGNLTIRADATIAVDSGLCPGGTWLEFELSYMGATAADCNANGLLDSCEIGNGWAVDTNGNGVIDLCESAFVSCPADFDQDGFVRSSDLAQLLNAWGPVPGLPGVDLVPDGVVDGSDLAVLLGAWGVCVE